MVQQQMLESIVFPIVQAYGHEYVPANGVPPIDPLEL